MVTHIGSFGAWSNRECLRIKKICQKFLPGGQIFLELRKVYMVTHIGSFAPLLRFAKQSGGAQDQENLPKVSARRADFLDMLVILCYIFAMANCSICKNVFMPNKYHPKQEICPNSACQRQRRLQNMRKWRLANPDYFKSLDQESAWSRSRYFYAKRWKEKNKDYLKEYAKTHKAKRREYMRGYMRKYRIAKNVNSNKI